MEPGEFEAGGGVIGRYHWDSMPWWPEPVRPPAGAPNVVLVVLDDVGYAQLGCFGSDIDTPTLDRLAQDGLRYADFHTTALCSPTRSCLLTGRNHHANGMGRITDLATGFPGYDARIPRANGFLSEVLVEAGYATWAVGKWHLTPEDECHLAAPRTRWPLSRGFERFYGFFAGETHQFAPALVHDSHFVDPPARYDEGYHLTEDLVDRCIEYLADLQAVDPDKPFFLYLATGACHSPHQSPPAWLARYRGRFDEGWDVWRERALARQIELGLLPPGTELSPRPEWVPAWDELSDDTRRVYARYMEAFAAFLSHTDDQLGRLVGFLEDTGLLDDTVVVVVSDNGASSEGGPTGSLNDVRVWNGVARTVGEAAERIEEIGGPTTHNNYPWGWTVAGNTPFRRWKREVHEGGIADPMIVHWPAGLGRPGEVRHQYVHAIDVAPTLLDLIGLDAPADLGGVAQRPLDGVSFASTLTDGGAPEVRTTQYYEMFGCVALYHDGWKAVTYHPIQVDEPGLDQVPWELYDLRVDPTECHDRADAEPERLAAMVERFWAEAERHQVLPLDNRPFSEFVLDRPVHPPPRRRYVYRPQGGPVPEAVAVNVKNRSHVITAHLDVPEGGADGVLLAQGSLLGGWSFHLDRGRPAYRHVLAGYERHDIVAAEPVAPGPHEVQFRFERTADHAGIGVLAVDGVEVARGEIPRFTPVRFSLVDTGITCGRSGPLPVCPEHPPPYACTGRLDRVVVEVDGERIVDGDAEAAVARGRQ